MKKEIDEKLNDYIDNQLNAEDLEMVNNLIESDSDGLNKLKALKLVDQSLKQLEVDNAPINFTSNLMAKLLVSKRKINNKFSPFLSAIFGFMGLIIVGSLGLMFSMTDWNFGNTKVDEYVGKSVNVFNSIGKAVSHIIADKTITLVTSTMLLITLILVYYLLEAHKNFKSRLKEISR